MAGNLLWGTLVLLFVLSFLHSLHYCKAFLPLDFVSFSSLFLRQSISDFRAHWCNRSEQSELWGDRSSVPCLCNTVHLSLGRNIYLHGQNHCAAGPKAGVPSACPSLCEHICATLSRRGRCEDSSRCRIIESFQLEKTCSIIKFNGSPSTAKSASKVAYANSEVFIQLWSTAGKRNAASHFCSPHDYSKPSEVSWPSGSVNGDRTLSAPKQLKGLLRVGSCWVHFLPYQFCFNVK